MKLKNLTCMFVTVGIVSVNVQAACPVDIGYVRDKLVFSEIKDDPGFGEPIDLIISKGRGIDNSISEIEKLVRETEISMEQAAQTAKQSFSGSGNALALRCASPQGIYCSANYIYHLSREAVFIYQENLNAIRCRKTGTMDRGSYSAALLR